MEQSASISLSIVIVNYNGGVDVLRCLNSVRGSSAEGQGLEVIVVDNGSTDSSVPRIQKEFPGVILLENGENRGFAAAANQGAIYSASEFIMFLNPDTELDDDFFERLAQFLRDHPQASIVGCKLVDARGRQQSSCWQTPNLETLLLEAVLPYAVSQPLLTRKPRRAIEVEVVSGACMVVRREDFQNLGGFDERFFMYSEDADLCLRARQSGLQVLFCPDAAVFHRVGGSPWTDAVSFSFANYKSKLMFFDKHFSPLTYGVARWIVTGGILLQVPVYLIAGVLSFNKKLIQLAGSHLVILPKLLKM